MTYTPNELAETFEHAADSLDGALNMLVVLIGKLSAGETVSTEELAMAESVLPDFRTQIHQLRAYGAAIKKATSS